MKLSRTQREQLLVMAELAIESAAVNMCWRCKRGDELLFDQYNNSRHRYKNGNPARCDGSHTRQQKQLVDYRKLLVTVCDAYGASAAGEKEREER